LLPDLAAQLGEFGRREPTTGRGFFALNLLALRCAVRLHGLPDFLARGATDLQEPCGSP
jgi:hypothetical protein